VLNVQKIDDRIRTLARFLSEFAPEDVLVVCRRENGWVPVKVFGKATGVNIIAGRYPPGMMTNPRLKNYTEPKILIVVDAWPDRNAVKDAQNVGIPVVGLCDTNNTANNLDLVVPCNNKGKKSLGLLFYILAREYLKLRGTFKEEEFKYTVDDFSPD
jgi:small subunit ribosomal protein S2